MPTTGTTTTRRRALGGSLLAGLTAIATVGLAPTAATAQAPGSAIAIDTVCADAPDRDDFDDVDDGDDWAEPVRCLAHARITQGVEAGRYAPAQHVSRQQMASFIARTMDIASLRETGDGVTELTDDAPGRFRDVPLFSGHWENVHRLAEAGIARGAPGNLADDEFGPARDVTRAQMASFIARAIGHLTGSDLAPGADSFDDDDTSVHEDSIDALAAIGIVQGHDDGTYRPDQPVSRASMAWYLTRTLAYLEDGGRIAPLPEAATAEVPLTVASPRGVVLTDADGATRATVSTDPATAAYAIGDDLVVYQRVGESPPLYPSASAEPLQVWSPSGTRSVPLADDTYVHVLDARVLDGTPTALVAETGGSTPDDAFLELVLLDLDDLSRTTVFRRDGAITTNARVHQGRILPDGDVVVLEDVERLLSVARWTPGAGEPVWTTGGVTLPVSELLVHDGTIRTLRYTSGEGPPESFDLVTHDPTTGAAVESELVRLADPAGAVEARLACGDHVAPERVACAHVGAAPLVVDLASGWFAELPAPDEALVTARRPAA